MTEKNKQEEVETFVLCHCIRCNVPVLGSHEGQKTKVHPQCAHVAPGYVSGTVLRV